VHLVGLIIRNLYANILYKCRLRQIDYFGKI